MYKQTKSKQFLNLINLNFIKFLKNPMNIIFSFGFPIVWMIIAYFAFGKECFTINNKQIPNFIFSFIGLTILPAASIAIINIPVSIGSDRINNRLKFFSTLNIQKYIYLISIVFVNLCVYLLVLIILMMLGNFAFNLFLPAHLFFSILFISILNFVFFTIIGLFLSSLAKNDKTNIFIALLVFYPIIFLSGITIPSFVFDANLISNYNGQWFKYLQFIVPGGSCYYLEQTLIFNWIYNKSLFDWKVDFLSILLFLIEIGIFSFLAWKLFKWK